MSSLSTSADVRRCLIESTNFTGGRWVRDWGLIKRFSVEVLGLYITRDELGHPDYPRYIVSSKKIERAPTSDRALGRLLGMTWTGQFHNYRMPRSSISIYTTPPPTIHLFTQVVVGSSVAAHRQAIQRMCRRWQRLWDRHTGSFGGGGFRFHVRVDHDPGTMERMTRLITDSEPTRGSSSMTSRILCLRLQKMHPSRLLQTQSGRRRIHEIYSTRIYT